MTALEEVRKFVKRLTLDEQQQLIEELGRGAEILPGIMRTPGVAGGDACIRSTRIPVWVLEEERRAGASAEAILRSHPGLTAQDLANAWAYSNSHRQEIDLAISENAAA